jgi:hypothetical protein
LSRLDSIFQVDALVVVIDELLLFEFVDPFVGFTCGFLPKLGNKGEAGTILLYHIINTLIQYT